MYNFALKKYMVLPDMLLNVQAKHFILVIINLMEAIFFIVLQDHDNPLSSNQSIAHFRDAIIRENSDQAQKRMKTYK
jgi:hypothetical protein